MNTVFRFIVGAVLGLFGAAWLYGGPTWGPGFGNKDSPPPAATNNEIPPNVSASELVVGAQPSLPEEPPAGATEQRMEASDRATSEYMLATSGYRGIVALNGASVFKPIVVPPGMPPGR